jgi:hypothetical protein
MTDPTTTGLRLALDQFGIKMPPPEAQEALGRLAGLQLASSLGSRVARRTLSRERAVLVKRCFDELELLDPPARDW